MEIPHKSLFFPKMNPIPMLLPPFLLYNQIYIMNKKGMELLGGEETLLKAYQEAMRE